MKLELGLGDVLRASDVTRWQIVNVHRPQSVAEHTFNVAMIALRLAKSQDAPTRAEVMMWALLHDLSEVVLGDIATPVKYLTGMKEKLVELEQSMSYLDHPLDGLKVRPAVKKLVKQADLIESILYLDRAGADSAHVRQVKSGLTDRLDRESWALYHDIRREQDNPLTMDRLAEVYRAKETRAEDQRQAEEGLAQDPRSLSV